MLILGHFFDLPKYPHWVLSILISVLAKQYPIFERLPNINVNYGCSLTFLKTASHLLMYQTKKILTASLLRGSSHYFVVRNLEYIQNTKIEMFRSNLCFSPLFGTFVAEKRFSEMN